MDYVGHVIRPPSEAYSMIIQVTVGCSHNQCTFCGTYKDQKFYIKNIEQVKRDIDEASSSYRYRKAFLADGDVLILPTATILEIMDYIRQKNPQIERIGVYGYAKAILKKTPEELKELHDAGLGIVYQGIESGNETILRKIKKGALPAHQLEAAEKVKASGMLLSQTVLLGLGGIDMSIPHAIDTGKHLGRMSPQYASALTVMLLPNTQLYREFQNGTFILPDKFSLLRELKLIIEHMDVHDRCMFTSNHASNYLPIKATLPEQKPDVLELLNRVIESGNEELLKPEHLRAL